VLSLNGPNQHNVVVKQLVLIKRGAHQRLHALARQRLADNELWHRPSCVAQQRKSKRAQRVSRTPQRTVSIKPQAGKLSSNVNFVLRHDATHMTAATITPHNAQSTTNDSTTSRTIAALILSSGGGTSSALSG